MLPHALASHALARLAQYGFTPRFGAEIECYVALPKRDADIINRFFAPVFEGAKALGIPLWRIEEERGEMQFELVLGVFDDPVTCCDAVNRLKALVESQAHAEAAEVTFAGKPFDDRPGSGLHLHVNLMHGGENAFHKTDDYISDALHYALGGLCGLTPYVMLVLCPDPESFRRYRDKEHVATTASWGSNNRSCAVRIPYTPVWENKRLEWRVPTADASVEQVLALMLHGIACGIDERMAPPAQSYGIASKEAEAIALPITAEAADAAMHHLPPGYAPLTAGILRSWRD